MSTKQPSKRGSITVLHYFSSFLNVTENWAYRLLRSCKSVHIEIGSQNFVENNYDTSGWTLVKSPKSNGRLAGWYYRAILAIRVLFGKANVVHCHYAPVGYAMRHFALIRNVKLVVSYYGYDYHQLPHNHPEWRSRYTELFGRADGFIAEGSFAKKSLVDMGCPASKVHVVKLGINPGTVQFYHRKKAGRTLRLIQIANFVEKKGHVYTVKAFNEVIKGGADVHLTLVGKNQGPHFEQAKSLVEQYGIGDHVDFVPQIDFSSLHSFLADFDVFIHPSCFSEDRDCEGGAPVVLLDAQATGMPIISTEHCDIPDEVIDGKTGFLSLEKDVNGIAQNIRKFIEMTEEDYALMSQNCRTHVVEEYDIEKNAKLLEQVYAQLLDNARGK